MIAKQFWWNEKVHAPSCCRVRAQQKSIAAESSNANRRTGRREFVWCARQLFPCRTFSKRESIVRTTRRGYNRSNTIRLGQDRDTDVKRGRTAENTRKPCDGKRIRRGWAKRRGLDSPRVTERTDSRTQSYRVCIRVCAYGQTFSTRKRRRSHLSAYRRRHRATGTTAL